MRALLLSGVLLLALAAPAQAAQVLSIDGAALSASDARDGDLCVDLELAPDESRGGVGTICADPPVRAYQVSPDAVLTDDRIAVGGAVPVGIARVEAESHDGTRFAADTVAGERYRGRHAGRVRFFLLSVPGSSVPLLRFYDAAGALVGAVEPPLAEDRVGAGPFRLLAQRGNGKSMRLSAFTRQTFAPTPLALDRIEPYACFRVITHEGAGSSESSACRDAGPFVPVLDLATEEGCDPLRSVLYGFVGDAVTAVRLKLGSGRTITVRTRVLPAPLGRRYVAARLPRGEAVRRATAVGARGAQEIGMPPGGLPCPPDSGIVSVGGTDVFDGSAPAAGPGEQVAAEDGGHRLVVRDGPAERLCAGLDGLQPDASDCFLPGVDPSGALVFDRDGMVSAVLPADVARVRLPGGREVATSPGAGYTGRYAGRLSFLLTELPAGTDGRLRYFSAAGERLGTGFVLLGTQKPGRTARLPGGLVAARYGNQWCVGLGASPDDCLFPFTGESSAYVHAGCNPRRAVLFGTLARRSRAPSVVLRGGRHLRARVITVPKRIGRGRVFVLALPRRARVERLLIDGERLRFPVQPASRQCGYVLSRPFIPR